MIILSQMTQEFQGGTRGGGGSDTCTNINPIQRSPPYPLSNHIPDIMGLVETKMGE